MANVPQRVLLVEDEPLVMQIAAELLTEDGFEVGQAESYEQALLELEARPDTAVVVTDISMPGQRDGIGLAQIVAERWPDMRIIIVSGQVRPSGNDYPSSAIFLTKPYAPGALLTLVKQPDITSAAAE